MVPYLDAATVKGEKINTKIDEKWISSEFIPAV